MVARLFSPRAELGAALVAGLLLAMGAVCTHGLDRAALGAGFWWASLAIGMVYGGRPAVDSLREKRFDIDVLMVVGAGLAAYLGAPAEGALLLFLFVLSGALEDLAARRTARAVEALSRLMPTAAYREIAGAPEATPERVAPEDLVAGDIVRVPPGEAVPADARVLSGASAVDQSNLTGESRPREVEAGDELYAGTINVTNPVRAVVLRPAKESSLQKILDLVLRAQEQREPVQRFIDRFSQPYALGVLGVSTVVLVIWWLALGRELADAAYTAITLLIVASPCALVISTPTATLAGISRGARAGVLFKGGQALERLARLRAVCFDKTGTLTLGKPRVTSVHPVGWSDERSLVSVAAALEAHSTHPIATAVVRHAEEAGVPRVSVRDVTYTAGRGVTGFVGDSEARLGSLAHTSGLVPACLRSRVSEVMHSIQSRGSIGVVIARAAPILDASEPAPGPGTRSDEACAEPASDPGQAGVIMLEDTVRPGAHELVCRLRKLGVDRVVMLTGDSRSTAELVARELEITDFRAELLPADKVEAVQGLKSEVAGGGGIGVIGDGVNDAPALAVADVSIAIGSIGSDAALESADIVLLADDLSVVPWAVSLARATRTTIARNLAFSVGAMAVMGVAVLAGSLAAWRMPLWLGVLGHEGGTVLVVLNSLRLLVYRGVEEVECCRRSGPSAAPARA